MRSERGDLIAILQEVQARFGYLPEEAMRQVARFVAVPESQVYGVATFYSQFRLTPGGRKTVRVCQGTACHVQGEAQILAAIKKEMGVVPGTTAPGGDFGLETVACLGACSLAPNMTVDGDVHGQLTPAKAVEIISRLVEKR
ncbi:MAG: NADH-quinone oxidoreductase subunit NuoE [Chloroflexi bacterium]|nr:NADH-quinone oxidoreductase subunit NuoE [Chloroflexota bacterium]